MDEKSGAPNIAIETLGFLAFLVFIKTFVDWQRSSWPWMVFGLLLGLPAYFYFLRDCHRFPEKKLGFILLAASALLFRRGVFYLWFGYVPLTGHPVTQEIVFRVFGLAVICLVLSGVCFWRHLRTSK
jgi:hypothetical protein